MILQISNQSLIIQKVLKIAITIIMMMITDDDNHDHLCRPASPPQHSTPVRQQDKPIQRKVSDCDGGGGDEIMVILLEEQIFYDSNDACDYNYDDNSDEDV